VNVTNSTPITIQGTVTTTGAQQEIGVSRQITDDTSGRCTGGIYTVPTGKQLVLLYAAAETRAPAGSTSGDILNGVNDDIFIPFIFTDQENGEYSSQQLHYVVPSGTTLVADVFAQGVSSCVLNVSIGGYLQPAPTS
jgi:hypothetical protein